MWMMLAATWLLACGGKATRYAQDETASEVGTTADGTMDRSSSSDDAMEDAEPLPEELAEPEAEAMERESADSEMPPDREPDSDAPLTEPGMACERDADCSTDFCDVGVCWVPDESVERVGATGPVYEAGHGALCDRATPCSPYVCKEGRCRYQ